MKDLPDELSSEPEERLFEVVVGLGGDLKVCTTKESIRAAILREDEIENRRIRDNSASKRTWRELWECTDT